MNGKQLGESLRQGRSVFGTLVVSPSPQWPPVLRQLGHDYVFIDTEHIALNREQVSWMCRAYAALDLAPVVRITSPNCFEASCALDGGAAGVVAPYIEHPDQVRDLVGAVKLKPLKGERLRAALSGKTRLEPLLQQYVEDHNSNRVVIVNIESVPALESLDAILDVSGLDAVLVGPHDLTCSLGIPEQYDHSDYIEAVDMIISKARKKGVGAGIHMIYQDKRMEQEIRWMKQGANLILHSADIVAFKETMVREIQILKKEASLTDGVTGAAVNINI